MNASTAIVRLVHIDSEPKARHLRITSESGVYRMGDRVLFEFAPGEWRRGHVDHRAPSGPGGIVMVTTDVTHQPPQPLPRRAGERPNQSAGTPSRDTRG